MKITIFNKLKKYESYLYTAHNGNFIRSLTNSQVEDLIKIGEELGIIYKNNHCPKCALDFVKKLAAPYYEQKKKLEEKKKSEDKKKENKNENDGEK